MDPIVLVRDLGIIPGCLASLVYILWRLGNKLTDGHLHFLTEMERQGREGQVILQGIKDELGNHSRVHNEILGRLTPKT